MTTAHSVSAANRVAANSTAAEGSAPHVSASGEVGLPARSVSASVRAGGAKKRARNRCITLESPSLRIEIMPELGGGIASFDWCDGDSPVPILRRCADPAGATDPSQLACYPLLPFSNRIGGGNFQCEGRRVAVPRNRSDETLPIHGDGWLSRWEVERRGAGQIKLSLDRSSESPYAYRAAQTFTLDGASLSITLEIENAGDSILPFGLGLHPFIERDSDTLVAAPANGLWLSDPDWLPTEHVRTPPAWQFGVAYPLPEVLVNHSFTDWAGWMTAHWPERQLMLTIQADTRCFVLYTPPAQDWFCFEPVDHPINAMNLAGGGQAHGMTLLAPGASLARTFSMMVERTGERSRPVGRQTYFSTQDDIQ
jgi:aldose 1-epimerase